MTSRREGRFDGDTVVVIGGSSGIGLACAVEAERCGASVVIGGRSEEKLGRAKALVGGDARASVVDVAVEESVEDFFEKIGGFEHLVVCAAETASAPIVGSASRYMRATIESRVWGGYYAAKHAAPRMRNGSTTGSITFMSGLSAHRPYPQSSITAASAGAIEAFARALALELAPVRVNAVCPGLVATPLLDDFYGKDRESVVRSLSERLPDGRIGEPEEIADAVTFLMGNGFVTGTVLCVDGGGSLV